MILIVNKLFMGALNHQNFSLSDEIYEGKIGLFKNLSTDSMSGKYVEQVKKEEVLIQLEPMVVFITLMRNWCLFPTEHH